MSDVEVLAKVLIERCRHVTLRPDFGWACPALNVIDCVLSLNRRYNAVVVPRVKNFAARRPEITELLHLRNLIDAYKRPFDFSAAELDYNDRWRSDTLSNVVSYLLVVEAKYEGAEQLDRLHNWAVSVRPSDSDLVGVRGFGLAGFQYLRMLFGAQTTKPDIHIRRFVSEVVGRNVSDRVALALLEKAAAETRLPLREVDGAIWRERANP